MSKTVVVPRFIEKEREKGSSDQEIKQKLVATGWQPDIINEAIKKAGSKKMAVLNNPDQGTILGIPKKPLLIGAAVFILLVLIALFI